MLKFTFRLSLLILLPLLLAGNPAADLRRALFIGDSITRNWDVAAVIPGAISSGEPGEDSVRMLKRTTPQMEEMRPRFVHVLGGTNDRLDSEKFRVARKVLAIASAARSSGARIVVVGTIPPVDAARFPMQHANAVMFNRQLKALAMLQGFKVADYYAAMILPNGEYRPDLFIDGIHPNAKGYAVMNQVLREAVPL